MERCAIVLGRRGVPSGSRGEGPAGGGGRRWREKGAEGERKMRGIGRKCGRMQQGGEIFLG
jgi:hypothetical protein